MKKKVVLGVESLLETDLLKNARVGLLCNQASVNHRFEHVADLFKENPKINLTTLFGPQHGIRGDVQDNMVETRHAIDRATRIPIYSLYSEIRQPTAAMFKEVDVLVCDLFDVGCRVYTFVYTLANCMRAAGELKKKVLVCDRPNPINGATVEGNLLQTDFASFVGQFPIAMRHGLTIGELALMFRDHFGIRCDLEVVPLENWRRELWYDEIDAPWVMPSPNMPALDAATVFPGTVIFEGTQISEGRGTTRPFELIGAPFIQAEDLASELNRLDLPGVRFRASNFLPTFQKHQQTSCGGVQLHVTDRDSFKPFVTGVLMAQTIYRMYPTQFRWKEPPYEYVFDKNPFDVINGGETIRRWIEQNVARTEIEESLRRDEVEFAKLRENFMLY